MLSDKRRRRDYDLHGRGGKGEGFIDAKARFSSSFRGKGCFCRMPADRFFLTSSLEPMLCSLLWADSGQESCN